MSTGEANQLRGQLIALARSRKIVAVHFQRGDDRLDCIATGRIVLVDARTVGVAIVAGEISWIPIASVTLVEVLEITPRAPQNSSPTEAA